MVLAFIAGIAVTTILALTAAIAAGPAPAAEQSPSAPSLPGVPDFLKPGERYNESGSSVTPVSEIVRTAMNG